MTFQVAMVCQDGIVIASDSHMLYFTPPTADEAGAVQHVKGSKFVASPNRKVICTYAGGPHAEPTARAVALAAEGITVNSEAEWRLGLANAADAIHRSKTSNMMDEVIVCRADTTDSFWIISKLTDHPAHVLKIHGQICAGNNSSSRFLIKRLYQKDINCETGKWLCLLALSFATEDDPSTVNDPFEITRLKEGLAVIPELESYTLPELGTLTAGFRHRMVTIFKESI